MTGGCHDAPLRYIHILLVFWSFLAGVITFYCSLGPGTLLPNVLFTLRPRAKVRPPDLTSPGAPRPVLTRGPQT